MRTCANIITWQTDRSRGSKRNSKGYKMAMKTIEQAIMCVEFNGANLRYIPTVLRTVEVCELALEDCSEALRYVPDNVCLLYTSDAADEEDSVDLGGRRI